MTDLTVTLTVPYAGVDRKITGSPLNIAKVAMLVEMGLPTLADMNLDGIPQFCQDADGTTMMGMGDGSGQEFITGSHTLIMAIRRVLHRPLVDDTLSITTLKSKPWGTGERRIVAQIVG